MSKEKIEMTEKQFEELCKAVYPHLKAIQEALKGNGEEMSASISVGSDDTLTSILTIQIGSFQSSKIHRQR